MILLKRSKEETNAVQTYLIIGKTKCGMTLKFEGMACYNFHNEDDIVEQDEIEKLAKEEIENGCKLEVEKIRSTRGQLLSFPFFKFHTKKMIENTVENYVIGMKLGLPSAMAV